MKLLLKIHSKDRHHLNLQRKRKYYRRVSKSSSSASSSSSSQSSSCPVDLSGRSSPYSVLPSAVAHFVARSGRNNQNRGLPSTGEQPSVLRQERYFLYGALILFVIIAFSTALYFVINHMQSDPTPNQPPILFGDSYASGTK